MQAPIAVCLITVPSAADRDVGPVWRKSRAAASTRASSIRSTSMARLLECHGWVLRSRQRMRKFAASVCGSGREESA